MGGRGANTKGQEEKEMFRICTVAMSLSRWGHCAPVSLDVTVGGTEQRAVFCLYCSLQLHGDLQLSQNKRVNFLSMYEDVSSFSK